MPTETEAPPAAETETREFGTPLSEIFAKRMPHEEEIQDKAEAKKSPKSVAEPIEETKPETKEAPKKQVEEKKVEKKAETKKEPEPKEDLLSDILASTTPKSEAAPEEDLGIEKVPVPEGFKGKTAEHFEKLSTSEYEARRAAKKLEKEIAQLREKTSETDPRVKQLEETNKDLLGRLERAGIEYHPWYEQNITVPRQNAMNFAAKAFEDAGGDPRALASALNLTGRQRAERLDELYSEIPSTTLRGKIERAVDAIETIDGRREQVLENREQVMKKLQETDLANQKTFLENHEKEVKNNLQDAEKFLLDKHNFFVFKEVDDPKFSWWNEQLGQMRKDSEDLMLRVNDTRQMAVAAKLASAAPVLFTMLLKEVAARKQAEKERDSYRDSEPPSGGGERKSKSEEAEEEDEKGSLASHILQSIKEAQAKG